MLDLATTESTVAVDVGDLDADPWLLNVANGTLDLRKGKLHPHKQSDLITRLAPVFLGNMHRSETQFLILGVFWPPRLPPSEDVDDLDARI